jgi:glutaconate CoA-transferase subunit B
MDTETNTPPYTAAELMVAAAAREIRNGDRVFVGMRLPLLGFLLAKSTHAPDAVGVYELGIVRNRPAPAPILTMGDLPNLTGAEWLTDTADVMGLLQRGEIDISFIGGAQVDRFGNLNTSYIGSPESIQTRLPGSGGACDLASLAGRHVIIMAHQRHRLVDRVDYITSPGHGDGPGWRKAVGLPRGGPAALITTLCVFRFSPRSGEARIASVHPGTVPETIRENTGWTVDPIPGDLPVTPQPTAEEIAALRQFDPERYWTA